VTAHLHLPHLPHPRLSDGFIACLLEGVLEGAFDHLHRPPVAHTDPAVIAAWGEWKTPQEWEAEHGGTGVS
jgi:hypothetical protein